MNQIRPCCEFRHTHLTMTQCAGSANAGKTCLVIRYTQERFTDGMQTTVGGMFMFPCSLEESILTIVK